METVPYFVSCKAPSNNEINQNTFSRNHISYKHLQFKTYLYVILKCANIFGDRDTLVHFYVLSDFLTLTNTKKKSLWP